MANTDETSTSAPVGAWPLFGAALALAVLAWVVAAVNTGIAYVALGADWVPTTGWAGPGAACQWE